MKTYPALLLFVLLFLTACSTPTSGSPTLDSFYSMLVEGRTAEISSLDQDILIQEGLDNLNYLEPVGMYWLAALAHSQGNTSAAGVFLITAKIRSRTDVARYNQSGPNSFIPLLGSMDAQTGALIFPEISLNKSVAKTVLNYTSNFSPGAPSQKYYSGWQQEFSNEVPSQVWQPISEEFKESQIQYLNMIRSRQENQTLHEYMTFIIRFNRYEINHTDENLQLYDQYSKAIDVHDSMFNDS